MNKKRMIIILSIFVILIVGGIFLLGQKADRKSNEFDSMKDEGTQENDAEEQDVKENGTQGENELPIISPSSNSKGESDEIESNSTSASTNNSNNTEEKPNGTEYNEISENVSEPDDNLDMELPFVPAD